MDFYEEFRQLSVSAFSSDSLCLIEAALRVVRGRYPNCVRASGSRNEIHYPARSDVDSCWEWDPMPRVDAEWTDYIGRLEQSMKPAEMTDSVWNMVQGDGLDERLVEDYLKLLRKTCLTAEVMDIRELQPGTNRITEGQQRPAVIPFRDGTDWAFAVAYSDCIHWYDSRGNRSSPEFAASGARRVVAGWRGPQQSRDEDSGIFMLMGIRLILNGTPHLSQRLADRLAETFRARMLVELLTEKIDPGRADYEHILRREVEEESLFFNDAALGTQLAVFEADSVPPTPPQSASASVVASLPPLASSVPSTPSVPSSSRSTSLSPPAPASLYNLPSSLLSPMVSERSPSLSPPPLVRDYRRNILDLLCKAVLFKRSATASIDLDVDVLWSLINTRRIRSPLHQRYHAVLFYDGMARQGAGATGEIAHLQKMRSGRSKCQSWKRISELGEKYGVGKYVVLCAISAQAHPLRLSRRERDRMVLDLDSRLASETDLLRRYLCQARDLCEAVLCGEIPEERLMIENYYNRDDEDIDTMYNAFVSVDPRPRVQTPR